MSEQDHEMNEMPSENTNGESSLPISRRRFLQVAAAGAGAAALASQTPVVSALSTSKENTGNAITTPALQGNGQPLPVPDPSMIEESWGEPWVWRPDQFPGEALQMNIVEHQAPTVVVGLGNPGAALFTYNGFTPGPTVRMSGDETLRLKIINHLGLNEGSSPVGPVPDPAAYPPGISGYPEGTNLLPDWCLGEHTNGVHSVRTTNLHTHGLHVRPGPNPDGTHSDNIYLRIMPIADYEMRQQSDDCNFLRDLEQVGEGDYEFRIGNVMGDEDQPHPPGTHWYHPHPHGATHNEVASGMAGFLIIEGDVDDAIAEQLIGTTRVPPHVPAGEYDYRERLMMIQRVFPGLVSRDPDAISKKLQNPTIPTTNGYVSPTTMKMRPGAIERWRVLNGSVDGKGYLRFMVLKGQWVSEAPQNPPEGVNPNEQLLRVEADGTRTIPTTEEIEEAKAHLYQLAFDGVTMVRVTGTGAEYYIKDLDFDAPPNPMKQDFTNLADAYVDAESLNATYNRPNEVYMAPANRVDVLFQAPSLEDTSEPDVYTILAKATANHTEELQASFQSAQTDLDVGVTNTYKYPGLPPNTIVAYLVVSDLDDDGTVLTDDNGTPLAPIPDFEILSLTDALPPVPPYLIPVTDEELQIGEQEAQEVGVQPGLYRTRRTVYSGWGAAGWPRFSMDQLAKFDTDGEDLGQINSVYLVEGPDIGTFIMPPDIRTMSINGRKFDPSDPFNPKIGLGTAEEWVVYNNALSLFGEYQYGEIDSNASWRRDHSVGYPVTRAEADRRGWNITTRSIDHPFHIHTNPFWLTRVEVPDENGNLVNILPEPRWGDVSWLPRNGGRIVFRSRFPDYVGEMVNHCHILLHEDNGMMQAVEIVPLVQDANYVAKAQVTNPDMTAEDVDEIYPPDSGDEMYKQNTRFIDPNTNPGRYQEYPATNGVFLPPALPDA